MKIQSVQVSHATAFVPRRHPREMFEVYTYNMSANYEYRERNTHRCVVEALLKEHTHKGKRKEPMISEAPDHEVENSRATTSCVVDHHNGVWHKYGSPSHVPRCRVLPHNQHRSASLQLPQYAQHVQCLVLTVNTQSSSRFSLPLSLLGCAAMCSSSVPPKL